MPKAYEEIARAHARPERVYVTRPAMPSLESFQAHVAGIWERRWLTNAGRLHGELEGRLAEYLGAPHLSLFCNGTIALLAALRLLKIEGGEVVTTPFTFPATAHALTWMGLRPVFCDIDPVTLNLDPGRIEAAITPETRAILPVHVYGIPCDVDAIQGIADRRGIRVLYDAAHTFGARFRGRALAAYGDAAMLSFHATKLFSTIEGGALVVPDAARKREVDLLKNFGIVDAETVAVPGINGKMNEFQAAFGLLHLEQVDREIAARRAIAQVYRDGLGEVPGITLPSEPADLEQNYAYFPIFVDPAAFGMSRDDLHRCMLWANIEPRKYFHPLCSRYPCYRELPSARPELLPVAERAAERVLCLPVYSELPLDAVRDVCALTRELQEAAGAG
ncbi:MAG TPA: DegT/DnrJ/EryC1/StrS family aminotransferase [Candidatus Hydrogenedentes bacterium]|nr:DegT/DnrJ/EryC1/StrS family aminotransferase [Candidatus Hydrogenedentota bacterium]